MLRRFCVLALAGAIAGCGAVHGVLPQAASDDSLSSMTVEQYAVSRLRAAQKSEACTKPSTSVPDAHAQYGLFVWLDSLDITKSQPQILRYLPKDPHLCGASIVVLWSGVDKGPAVKPQYDFGAVETAIQPWAAAKKRVNLLFAGVDEVGPQDRATPAWVLAQSGAGKVDVVPCPNPGTAGSVGPPTPVYWERGYSRPWRAFIAAAIARYAHDPRIGYMRFGIGAGAEDFPQHGADANCFSAWQKYGLSAQFWARFSSSLVRAIAADTRASGSQVQQLVALNTFDDPAAPFNVPDAVAHVAAANGVGIGTENLGAGNYGTAVVACTANSPQPYWCAPFRLHRGAVPLQFQPISYTLNPAFPNLAPLPKLLPYAIYNGAQIFELYPQEWLAADDPSWPTYKAHHKAWTRALAAAAAALGEEPPAGV
jgi:hypothetical protein